MNRASDEYDSYFQEGEGVMFGSNPGITGLEENGSSWVELSEETFDNVVEEAERRGYEAARRELLHAITDMTTSQRTSREFEHKISSPIGYNHKTKQMYRYKHGEETVFLEETRSTNDTLEDKRLALLPLKASDTAEELPEFLSDDKETADKEDPTAAANKKMKVGWYIKDTNLLYWTGVSWVSSPKEESTRQTLLPISELEKLEYLESSE